MRCSEVVYYDKGGDAKDQTPQPPAEIPAMLKKALAIWKENMRSMLRY
jgi:hypothetical protein